MQAEAVVALCYRVGRGCRQEPFSSVVELRQWLQRYSGDLVRVQLVRYRRIVSDRVATGAEHLDALRAGD
ncbi:MAG: hypothetical protein H7831_15965 [Magnetococcus sp. WYHC-3]